MKRSILVVDDEVVICELIKDYLESLDFEVHTAYNGVDGLAEAARLHPDLILSDLVMGKMSGGKMAAEMQSNPALSSIPIIYMTGIVTHDEASRTENQLAGNRILAKPFTRDELVHMIEHVLGLRDV